MPNEHLILCGSAKLTSRKKEWREAKTHRLRIGTGKEHVHLKIEHITRKMAAQLPTAAIDLVEIAAYVYSADQVVTRGGMKEFNECFNFRAVLCSSGVRCTVWEQTSADCNHGEEFYLDLPGRNRGSAYSAAGVQQNSFAMVVGDSI